VRVPPALLPILSAISEHLGGALALVSGRKLAQLEALFGSGLALVGEHGADSNVALPRTHTERIPAAVHLALTRFVREHPDCLVEEKRFAIALHTRRAPAEVDEAARTLCRRIAERHEARLRLIEGRRVFEFTARGINKGAALATLLARRPFLGRRAVMIGDDATDEAGFAEVNRGGGLSILVHSAEERASTCARFALASPSAVRLWLARSNAQLAAGLRQRPGV
jgi:trehalose 6-phosphate phosphatase